MFLYGVFQCLLYHVPRQHKERHLHIAECSSTGRQTEGTAGGCVEKHAVRQNTTLLFRVQGKSTMWVLIHDISLVESCYNTVLSYHNLLLYFHILLFSFCQCRPAVMYTVRSKKAQYSRKFAEHQTAQAIYSSTAFLVQGKNNLTTSNI